MLQGLVELRHVLARQQACWHRLVTLQLLPATGWSPLCLLPRPLPSRRSAWIVIDETGKRSFMHADKRSLIVQLGLNIPIRDMRLLDFNLLSSGGHA